MLSASNPKTITVSDSTTTNFLPDVIRVMTVMDFHKTEAAVPDEVLRARFEADGGPAPDIWGDWAECVRGGSAARL